MISWSDIYDDMENLPSGNIKSI